MKDAITFVLDHKDDVVAILGGLIIAARVIVKLTPTPADDSALEKVVNVLKHIGLHIGK
jgi:hypothetical protein